MTNRPLSRVRRNICALLLALLLLSWGYFAFSFTGDYRGIEQQCKLNLASIAMGLEAHTRQLVQITDILLLEMAKHFPHYPLAGLEATFSDWFRRSLELAAVAVVDIETEDVLFSLNEIPLPGELSIGSLKLTDVTDTSLQISAQLVSGSDGRQQLVIYRHATLKGHRLLVAALMYADAFLDFHQDVNLGPDGSVSIFHRQGLLLARKPGGSQLAGRSFAEGPLFSHLLKESPVGFSRAPETTDGISRFVAHRQLNNLPLVVTVGTSIDWVFADWRERLFNFLIILLAFSLSIIVALVTLFRSLARVEKAEMDLAEREEHFRSVANSSVDAVISTAPNERVSFWSIGAEKIFGCSTSEALGMPISCFLQFSEAERPLTLKQLIDANSPWSQQQTMDVQGQRKNGEIFVTELSVSRGKAAGKELYTLIVRDVTERKQMEERIKRMASHDNLTGLPNRGLLMDRLQVAMAQVRRQGGQFALLFIDLDQFKPVNDNFGHEAGDQLLQQVAKRMQDAVRASDTIARVGGDEFAALLLNVEDQEAVCRACEHLLHALRKEFYLKGKRVCISCSIGVVFYNGQDSTPSELIGQADNAMYAAKRSGKNRFTFAGD